MKLRNVQTQHVENEETHEHINITIEDCKMPKATDTKTARTD